MRDRRDLFCAVLVFLCVLSVSTPALPQRFDGEVITEINVSGNSQTSDQLIRSHLRTRVGARFSSATAGKDVRELFSLGYFSDVSIDVERGDAGLILTYLVIEKPVIEAIEILGNQEISDKELRESLTVRATDTYSTRELKAGIKKIKSAYAEKAYPAATVDTVIHPVDDGKVHLVITINEGRKSRIRGIYFVGTEAFTDKKLLDVMRTKKAFWFIGGKFEQEKLDLDLDMIIAEYGDAGYADARILGTDLEYRDDGSKLYLTIYIEEGPQYTVGDVSLANNHAFLDRELYTLISIKPGDIFNKGMVYGDRVRAIQGDPGVIRTFYVDNGYLFGSVTPEVRFDRETHTANVTYNIHEDRLIYVSAIDITGNVRTKDEVVRRRLEIRPGDRFSGEKIRGSVRNIQNLGFFEQDSPEVGHRVVDDQWADLMLHMTEGDMGMFNVGGGFSSDAGALGFLNLSLNNFDISRWPTFSGGGQRLNVRLEQGNIRKEYSIGFRDPYFLSYPFSFGVNLYTRSFDYYTGSDFSQEQTGSTISFGKRIAEDVDVNLDLRAEVAEISNVESHASNELKLEEDEGAREMFSVATSIVRDTRDYFYDPTEGSRLRLGVELAGGPFGGETDFVKVTENGTWYWSFFEKYLVLMVQERIGYVEEYAGTRRVPLFERFFAGGTSTVRGYDFRDVGPKSSDPITDPDTGEVVGTARDPIGGRIQAIGNVELGLRPNEFLGLYVFMDTGTVWQDERDINSDEFRHSAGVGLGLRTPMGPLRFDYGIPLNPDKDQGNGRLHFTTGLRF